jgi:hypothetical protein
MATSSKQSAGYKRWHLDALRLTREAKGGRVGCWTVEGYVGIEGTFSGQLRFLRHLSPDWAEFNS